MEHTGLKLYCAHCGFEHVDASAQFCSRCGAIAHDAHASTWSIITDWSEHYIGSHGALWRTLKQLCVQPGGLTQAYFAGARGSTLKPIQLYLLASIFCFFVVGLISSTTDSKQFISYETGAAAVTLRSDAKPAEKAGGSAKLEFNVPEPSFTDASFHTWIAGQSFPGARKIQKRALQFRSMTKEQQEAEIKRGASKFTPIIALLLVPFFALFTKLVWNHRVRFAEHIVFALHLQTVALLLAVPLIAAELFDLPTISLALVAIAFCVWSWLAARRVFARSVVGTNLRFALSVLFYILALTMAVVCVLLLAFALG